MIAFKRIRNKESKISSINGVGKVEYPPLLHHLTRELNIYHSATIKTNKQQQQQQHQRTSIGLHHSQTPTRNA